MTNKEIAIELLNKFWHVQANNGQVPLYVAKNCALIAIDELIYYAEDINMIEYFKEIKKELEKL
jgi:hypothetical protein